MECVLPSPCGMSISLLPDEPNPLCCRRTPVMHSLAALIQAIPSRVANPTVFLPFHRHAWLLQSTFCFVFSLLSKQSHKRLLCPDCVGKSWGWRLAVGGTHLLVPVGPSGCWDAGCLLSCSGFWGRSGQQVCAKVSYKGKKELRCLQFRLTV